ncbi:MAG TPA: AAA family ATPase [Bacteriovoracaceae bacterium]|nr:AAA family ATPase [Bacteriovoracaceae bacterium]
MIVRLFKPPKSHSFFLFGARGTGKSTLLKDIFDLQDNKKILYLDLLDPAIEKDLAGHPERLLEIIDAYKVKPEWVVIDEIQKIPKLLDVAHKLIFEKKVKFALTGSSARKLRRDSANLLAGRAFSFYLYPLTFIELKKKFHIDDILSFGSLPEIFNLESEADKKRYLLSYVQTYIKEEVLVEQLVRNIDPFRSFLEVAAQSNTEIINYTTLAREAGINSKSVERYFSILSDTLLGHFLEPYSKSVRARQKQSPKFYFFDCGVVRALSNEINQKLLPQTFSYGKHFEQLVVSEFIRLNSYYEKNWKFSYIRTGSGVEIDLVIEKNKKDIILVEIKSTTNVHEENLSSLIGLGSDFKSSTRYLLCQEKLPRMVKDIRIMNWMDGIKEIFDQ